VSSTFRSAVLAVLALLALAVAGCGGDDDGGGSTASADSGDAGGKVTLRVGTQKDGIRAVLQKSGQLDDLPYEIEWSTFVAGPPLVEAAGADRIDVAWVGCAPPIFGAAAGADFKVIAAVQERDSQENRLLVPQDSDIASVEDLKGKKLGVGALTWGNLPMSRLMLRDAGITWMKDIEVLPVGVGPASWARLKNGSVDALNLPSTQHEMMAQAGTAIRRLPIPEQFQNVFSNGLAASDKLIQDNPKLIEGMGRAIAKSQVACMANFEACVRAYWQIDPSSKPAADKQDEWVRTFVAVNKRTAEIGQLSQRDGRHGAYTADDWKNFVAKMKEGEQIANDNFDISSLYTDRFVKAFNDFDLEAVRAAARNVKQ